MKKIASQKKRFQEQISEIQEIFADSEVSRKRKKLKKLSKYAIQDYFYFTLPSFNFLFSFEFFEGELFRTLTDCSDGK